MSPGLDAELVGELASDVTRRMVVVVAVVVSGLAAVADSGGLRALVLVVAVVTFMVWARRPGLPVVVLVPAVLTPAVVAQLTGRLEPAMFTVALLVFAVAGYEAARWRVALACVPAVLSPLVLYELQPATTHLSWTVWTIAIGFSAVVGRGMFRQQRLVARLAAVQRQLADQAQAAERRRIARDVHDLVGHGLASMLMQVASASHVLGRDPDAAAEALAAAQDAGRRSLRDLRGAVALLRDERDAGGAPPNLGQLEVLVDAARGDGLDVTLRVAGDRAVIAPSVGLALCRIVQEALHNAARHAPHAATAVTLSVGADHVTLTIDSIGPRDEPSDPERPRYGLVGMRERASVIGGELRAGPTADGWCVECDVPVEAP